MKTETLIEKLKNKASTDPVANDLFTAWTMRQRARQVVMLDPLHRRMVAEGFKHTKAQYAEVLKFLAGVNVGVLALGPKGKVKGLKGIQLALSSIGRAAVDTQTTALKGFRPKSRFQKLDHVVKATRAATRIMRDAERKAVPAPAPVPAKAPVAEYREGRKPRPYQTAGSNIVLTFLLNDKPINIPVPSDLTRDDIADLVAHFQEKSSSNKDKDF